MTLLNPCLARRRALHQLLGAAGLLAVPAALRAQGPTTLVEVWKSPTCGCCKDWIYQDRKSTRLNSSH